MTTSNTKETKKPAIHGEKYRPYGPAKRTFYWFARTTLWILYQAYFRATVYGKENIPKEGPVIVVSNHQSHLDPPLVGIWFRRQMFFMAKAELFKGWFGRLINTVGAFPVRRGAGDRAAIRYAQDVLKDNQALLFFPEGTRSRTGELQEAQLGIGMLLSQFGDTTILPVFLDGSFDAMPPGASFPRPRKITVHIGKGFKLSSIKVESKGKKHLYQEIGNQIMEKISSAPQTS